MSRQTRCQISSSYYYYTSDGTTQLVEVDPNQDSVGHVRSKYESRLLQLKPVPPRWDQVEVYRFPDLTNKEAKALGDIESYFQTHQADFELLDVMDDLPRPKDKVNGLRLIDFFLRIPPSPPSQEPEDQLADLPTIRFKQLGHYARVAKAPSEASKVAEYRAEQGRDERHKRFLDGRYDFERVQDNIGVPVEIFHDIFAEFEDKAQTVDVPRKTMVKVMELFHASSAIYALEHQRSKPIMHCLSEILGFTLSESENAFKTVPEAAHWIDVATSDNAGTTKALVILEEMKLEFGTGASSPETQAENAVRRTWAQPISYEASTRCCCPTFVIAIGGPYIMILGIVITDTIHVRRLTPWLSMVNVSLDDRPYEQVGRVLFALRMAIAKLKTYWMELPVPKNPSFLSPSRFLPWRTSYTDTNGQEVKFQYLRPFEDDPSTVTFLARHTEGVKEQIVVKFVKTNRYGTEAHKLLAAENFAPPLLFFGPLSSSCTRLSMVVMGHVNGYSLVHAAPPGLKLHTQLKDALKLLHDNNYVFGDLREQNIMVDDSTNKVKLIDFDWVGTAGEAIYPYTMNNSEAAKIWATGMGRGEVMQKEHDDAMLAKMGLVD